jgi:tetratricopeptide (TPR) repeat protein
MSVVLIIRHFVYITFCSVGQRHTLSGTLNHLISHSYDLNVRFRISAVVLALLLGTSAIVVAAPKSADQELNQYYSVKRSNPQKAKPTLESIVQRNPKNLTARKELGYLLIEEKNHKEALQQFQEVQKLDPHDAQTNMQVAFLLDRLDQKSAAYKEFKKEATGPPSEKQQEACIALINLADANRKVLADPYFADLYLNPSYNSRFDNGLWTANARAGVSVGLRKEWDFYAGLRGTRDTESRGGTAPQIFSDNASIFSLGAKFIPFREIPVALYAEAGRGYDLVEQNRDRWRGDVRGGIFAYQAWGTRATCVPRPTFSFKHMGNVYADVSYYSRYDDNVIGYLRIREGLRVFEMNRSAVDVFLMAFGAIDSNHEFFNNLGEIGPSIAFIPDHTWNLALRYTAVKGRYATLNTASPNPYSKSYSDNRFELEGYWRF